MTLDMVLSKIKSMAQPIPLPEVVNWTELGVIWTITTGMLAFALTYLTKYFSHKRLLLEKSKEDQQSFIQKLVITTVTSTMEGCLKDIKEDVSMLFRYREEDRKNIDEKFMLMSKEIRK